MFSNVLLHPWHTFFSGPDGSERSWGGFEEQSGGDWNDHPIAHQWSRTPDSTRMTRGDEAGRGCHCVWFAVSDLVWPGATWATVRAPKVRNFVMSRALNSWETPYPTVPVLRNHPEPLDRRPFWISCCDFRDYLVTRLYPTHSESFWKLAYGRD